MAAALLRAAAANPKLTQSIAKVATDTLNASSSQLREKFSTSSAPTVNVGAASPGTTSTTYQTFRTMNAGLCRVIQIIWDKLKDFFRFLFLTRSPAAYVVWLIILILIILIVVGVVKFGKKRSTLARNKNVEDKNSKKQKSKSSALSEKPTNEGYRKKAVEQSVSGEPNKVDGYKRNLLSGGRCDGLNWITDGKDCLKILPPPMIRWELNPDEYKELGDIPEELLKQDAFKDISAINIPYTLYKDRYYVDCANMTYEDDNNETTNKPAKLFNQKNIKDNLCQYIVKPTTQFTKDYRAVDKPLNKYTVCEK